MFTYIYSIYIYTYTYIYILTIFCSFARPEQVKYAYCCTFEVSNPPSHALDRKRNKTPLPPRHRTPLFRHRLSYSVRMYLHIHNFRARWICFFHLSLLLSLDRMYTNFYRTFIHTRADSKLQFVSNPSACLVLFTWLRRKAQSIARCFASNFLSLSLPLILFSVLSAFSTGRQCFNSFASSAPDRPSENPWFPSDYFFCFN